MKYFKYLLVIPFICFYSCSEELEEVNINLNSPTEVSVDRFIVGLERDLSRNYAVNSFDLTNKIVNYTEYPVKHWDHFLTIREAGADWWITHFNELRNVDYILENAGVGEENFKGVGLVLKSWMYYVFTSLYGDVPLNEAGKAAEGINQPAYDTQEDIFSKIIEDLDEANTLLGTGSIPLVGDILLDNDVSKWQKFANSLKVRVLIAQSGQVDPSSELQKMIDDPNAYPLMESNDDQPEFSFYNESIYPRNKEGLFFIIDVFMCKDFIDKLLLFEDERIMMYAAKTTSPVPGDYAGVPSGVTSNPPGGTVSKVSDLIFEARTNFAVQVVWMNYAELQFLLAEAAENSWISGGSTAAMEYYEKGIEASFNYQKERLDVGIAEGMSHLEPMLAWDPAYLTKVGVEYTGSKDNKLELIATQKWLALYLDMESYFSWRRTQLPALNFDPANENGGVPPSRFKYPVNERIYNTQNYEAAVAIQGADDWNTQMWILK